LSLTTATLIPLFFQSNQLEGRLVPKLQNEVNGPQELGLNVAFDANIAGMALASMFIILRPLVSMFLFVIVMSILARPFTMLKSGSRYG